MTERIYKEGDLVRLKSGGPIMTVCDDRTDHIYTCRWFANDLLQTDAFSADEVTPCTEYQRLIERYGDEAMLKPSASASS